MRRCQRPFFLYLGGAKVRPASERPIDGASSGSKLAATSFVYCWLSVWRNSSTAPLWPLKMIDLSVLASYEFHGTHPGWHLLASCQDIAKVPSGVMIGPWQRRIPKARAKHRKVDFRVRDDDTALTVGAEFFRLHKEEGGLL